MQLVEAPSVPATEVKSAVRWELKDLLDYPVDAATVDVADVPKDQSGQRTRAIRLRRVGAQRSHRRSA